MNVEKLREAAGQLLSAACIRDLALPMSAYDRMLADFARGILAATEPDDDKGIEVLRERVNAHERFITRLANSDDVDAAVERLDRGDGGRVVAVEVTPEMLDRAEQAAHGLPTRDRRTRMACLLNEQLRRAAGEGARGKGGRVQVDDGAIKRIARSLFECGDEVAGRLILVQDPGPGEYAKLATGRNLGGLCETAVIARLRDSIDAELRRAAGEGA